MAATPLYQGAGTMLAVASAASANIDVPDSVAIGDTIIVFLYKESTAAVTIGAAGFVALSTPPAATGTGAHTLHAYWKNATAADATGGTYGFTWTGSVNRTGVAIRISGGSTSVGLTTVVAETRNFTVADSDAFPNVSYSTNASKRLIVWAGGQSTSGSFTPPTGMTERVDTGSRIGVATVAVDTQRGTSSASVTLTGGSGADSAHTAWCLEVRPEPTAPSGPSAGADVTVPVGANLHRVATLTDDGASFSSETWTVVSGPVGAGSTLSTTATVETQFNTPGTYVLRYTYGNFVGNTTDDVTVTVPTPTTILGGTVGLIVSMAWGADLTADPDTWAWTDITGDVRQSDGTPISITAGRGDEADTTQPAQCSILLDNRAGAYSLGGQSSNWPYVRRNTPVRVAVQLTSGAAPTALFEGYAVSWAPDWDTTGADATVALTAAGQLRRMERNSAPLISAWRRAILAGDDVVAYWPMEEGSDAAQFAAAVGGVDYPMVWNPDFDPPLPAAAEPFLASAPLPTIAGTELYAPVPRYTADDDPEAQVRLLIEFPESGIANLQPLVFLDVSGTSDWWIISYGTGGALRTQCLDRYGDLQASSLVAFDVDGRRLLLSVALDKNGSRTRCTVTTLEPGALTGDTASVTTDDSRTLGALQAVWINTHVDDVDDGVAPAEVIAPSDASLAVGHVVVTSQIKSIFDGADELRAWDGELATDRLDRVASEADLTINSVDPVTDTPSLQFAEYMGPQFGRDVLDLLRDIEAVEGGILYDGPDFGLTYMTRRARYNRAADVTLNVTSGQLLPPFTPVDDDQRQVNRATVERSGGSQVTVEDATGDLGTAAIGPYDTSVQRNTHDLAGAANHAGWLVHQGTTVGYRYPELQFSLAKSPTLTSSWVATPLGGRIDAVNLLDARTQLPGDDQSFALEGYTQSLTQRSWDVTVTVSPYEPWRVAEVAASSAATDEFVSRVDTTGSTLASAMSVSATSISVATAEGALWTTDSAQYPLVLDVGGIPVTATACSGASSPQTFTVTGSTVTTAKAAGVRVQVWQPAIAAL